MSSGWVLGCVQSAQECRLISRAASHTVPVPERSKFLFRTSRSYRPAVDSTTRSKTITAARCASRLSHIFHQKYPIHYSAGAHGLSHEFINERRGNDVCRAVVGWAFCLVETKVVAASDDPKPVMYVKPVCFEIDIKAKNVLENLASRLLL